MGDTATSLLGDSASIVKFRENAFRSSGAAARRAGEPVPNKVHFRMKKGWVYPRFATEVVKPPLVTVLISLLSTPPPLLSNPGTPEWIACKRSSQGGQEWARFGKKGEQKQTQVGA